MPAPRNRTLYLKVLDNGAYFALSYQYGQTNRRHRVYLHMHYRRLVDSGEYDFRPHQQLGDRSGRQGQRLLGSRAGTMAAAGELPAARDGHGFPAAGRQQDRYGSGPGASPEGFALVQHLQ